MKKIIYTVIVMLVLLWIASIEYRMQDYSKRIENIELAMLKIVQIEYKQNENMIKLYDAVK